MGFEINLINTHYETQTPLFVPAAFSRRAHLRPMPVNSTAGAITITPPTSPVAGVTFARSTSVRARTIAFEGTRMTITNGTAVKIVDNFESATLPITI